MNESERRYWRAIRVTKVVRPPRQALATFGSTVIRYYLVAEPVYAELDLPAGKTRPWSGRVWSERNARKWLLPFT